MKYVSDKFAGQDYADIEIPEGGSFADMVKLIDKKDIGEGTRTDTPDWKEHNDNFIAHMDRFMPNWREIRKKLNGQILDYFG